MYWIVNYYVMGSIIATILFFPTAKYVFKFKISRPDDLMYVLLILPAAFTCSWLAVVIEIILISGYVLRKPLYKVWMFIYDMLVKYFNGR
jgi:hypothetical protein